jgi:dihydrofolate reductase
MSKVIADITASLDGFVAGPDAGREHPLGIGGEELHEWALATRAWREPHGREGGEEGPDNDVIRRSTANVGAVVMGRRMFSGDDGPWGDEPWGGWWGDEPPFHCPVYVLTNYEREPLEKDGGTTFYFVTDGIESALAQAKDAAGDKDISIAGGADVIQQYLRAGAVDELQLHIAPRFLGGGTRLFEDMPAGALERIEVLDSPNVTHLRYRMRRAA